MNYKPYKVKPWKAFYCDKVKNAPLPENKTVVDYLKYAAENLPERCALICGNKSITFAQLNEYIDQFADYLSSVGVGVGTRVSVALYNCIPLVITYYAVLSLGGVLVMNNPGYTSNELCARILDSKSEYLVCHENVLKNAEKVRCLLEKIIVAQVDDVPSDPDTHTTDNSFVNFNDCINDCFTNKKRLIKRKKVRLWNRPACYQYTGGTSGELKAIMLTHNNLSIVIQRYINWFCDCEFGKEIFVSPSPFFHIYGMQLGMNLAVAVGATNILVPKAKPETLIDCITDNKATYAVLVPTHISKMLECPSLVAADMSSIKMMTSGGSSLSKDIAVKFEKVTGVKPLVGYGLTEAAPVTHFNPHVTEGDRRKHESIGIPVQNTYVKIVDPDSQSLYDCVKPGEAGLMLIKGQQVAKYCYIKGKKRKLCPHGWLNTGDIAYMDDDGYFFITGRKKDIIVSSAYKIFPHELEDIIRRDERVESAIVFGVPDKMRGESVAAIVTLKDNCTCTANELVELCRRNLVKYKWPVILMIRPTLCETSTGKIPRAMLKKTAIDSLLAGNKDDKTWINPEIICDETGIIKLRSRL